MRIGIFSDIHSNIEALDVVLECYRELAVDRYVCLGDVVGYGGSPEICCNRVRELVDICILGNHDAAVSGRMDYAYYYAAARNALDHHASLISPASHKWLSSLPYTVNEGTWCFSHGSPIKPEAFDYVFNVDQAEGLLPHWDQLAPITFIGHSHLTKAFALNPPGTSPRVIDVTGDRIAFDINQRTIATVGSVGQPRDNDARACFTVFDTETLTLDYHRVDYDIISSARRIFDMGELVPDFGKRLFLGI